jgi:precorrin-6B methylase 2
MPDLRRIIADLKKHERRVVAELARIQTAISSLEFGGSGVPAPAIIETPAAAGQRSGRRRRRKMSAAARARIAAAQKRRWAKVREAKSRLAQIIVALLAAGTFASAQPATQQEPYEPTPGQSGKDVVWVPTPEAMVQHMLEHAGVTPQDFVMDLGSGDGRMIIAAARRGARGLGVEFNPDMVEYARRLAAEAGVADRAQFAQGDMYEADISKATVLALFLLPGNLEKLVPKFLDLPPGTRIVANTFWVRDWTADDVQTLEGDCSAWCMSQLFIIPARVQGNWRAGESVLSLTQKFQMIEGTYTPTGGAPAAVKGRLRGTAITVTLGGTEYDGTVNGNSVQVAAKAAAQPSTLTFTRVQ